MPFNKGKSGTLKTFENFPKNRLDEIDLLKLKYRKKIKNIKVVNKLSNNEICNQIGINRVFLSKILNNKTSGISVKYLKEKWNFLACKNK